MRSLVTGCVVFFAVVLSLAQESGPDITRYLSRIDKGEADQVRSELPALLTQYPNNPGVLYVQGVLTTDGTEAVRIYQSIVDNFPKSEWADDALYKVYQFYYAIGLYRTAEMKLNQLRADYPRSKHLTRGDQAAPQGLPDEKDSSDVLPQDVPASVPGDSTAVSADHGEPSSPAVPAGTRGQYALQVGAYSQQTNAEKQKLFFEDLGYAVEVINKVRDNRPLFVVLVGEFKTPDEARVRGDEIRVSIICIPWWSRGNMQTAATRSDFRNSQEEYGILGESVEMKKIVEVIEQVGPTDITVLISGESGVGKEVVAKAIHAASLRSKSPLITVNSGAIPEGIMESELFGHEKGSFTGASDLRKGYFELADGGTIFLDEIGELPLSAQVKFLRILESGEFQRVGSSVQRRVDVRVIAATNKDLESEVRNNQFRADLFYRLRSVNIHIPPLRKRAEDIELFFRHFVDVFTVKNKTRFGGISDEAMHLLKTYHWPGNVRELRNVVESMLVIEGEKHLEAPDVKKYLKEYREVNGERNLPVPLGRTVEQAERELILRALLDIKGNILDVKNLLSMQEHHSPHRDPMAVQNSQEAPTLSLRETEKRAIADALQRYKGNRRAAARSLNISERTLYRKIKEYGLE